MRMIVPLILAAFFVVVALAIGGANVFWATYEDAPPQPVAFPHDIHAGNAVGQQNLPCTRCHLYVEVSRFATIPPMSVCMECHGNMQSDKPEIIKLKQYWERQEPIPWQRIHSVPKHVYFSHKRHIKAGVDCAVCHGDMKVVNEVKKVRTLQMGFCVSCHRANAAPTDCWTCHH